jgi:Cu/Ag efflux pump CusA
VVKTQLRNVNGVTDINSIGCSEKQYVVAPNLERLGVFGLSLADIVNELEKNKSNLGAGYIERRGEQYLVRAPGQVKSRDDIRDVNIGTAQGQPIRVRDVADVELGRELRTGAATENGKEVGLGTVFMLMGENSRSVSRSVDKQMAAINKTLPAGWPSQRKRDSRRECGIAGCKARYRQHTGITPEDQGLGFPVIIRRRSNCRTGEGDSTRIFIPAYLQRIAR